jgi:hypothetical protein
MRSPPLSHVLGRRQVPLAGALIGGAAVNSGRSVLACLRFLQRSIESRVDRPETSADSAAQYSTSATTTAARIEMAQLR